MAGGRKGTTARTIIASTRISAAEEEALVLRYGTAASGLRAAVDTLMTVGEAAAPPRHTPKMAAAGAKPHRHVRTELVRTEWVQGQKVKVYRCECGTEVS